jgi:MYXO-CTERM domain-containing protein
MMHDLMKQIPGLWLALGAAALATTIDAPARAAGPGDATELPWGIYQLTSGRYAQDMCDHSFARPCLTKRVLPEGFVPELVPAGHRRPRPLAGGYCAQQGGGGAASPIPNTMAPTDILTAYSVPSTSHGYGKIVALVDMPDSHVYADLNVYRMQYGMTALPQCATGFPDGKTPCFAQVDETGATPNYTSGDCPGADGETALDVEMVTAACPDCAILVVQMTNALTQGGPSDGDFLQGAETAATLGAVATSISFGGSEYQGEPTGYTTPGHLVLAASGDSGYLNILAPQNAGQAPSYPASAPDVLGVGGTTLVSLGGGSYGEKVWDDVYMGQGAAGGSGCSIEYPMPAFQTTFLASNPGAFGTCTMRDSVDVSAAAEFNSGNGGGISEYDSSEGGWVIVTGTSAASPTVAAIFTRVGVAEAVSNDLGFPYKNIAAFNKVIAGGTNAVPPQTCTDDPVQCTSDGGTGWNGPTGVGTPNGAMLAPLGTPNPPPPATADAGAEGGTDSGAALDSGSVATADSGSGDSGSAADGGPADTSEKSGCGCSTVGTEGSALGGLGLLAMGAGALVVVRRRRR